MMTHPHIKVLMMLECLQIGGTETNTLSITKQLIDCGIDVTIYSLSSGNIYDNFMSLGCSVYIGSKNMVDQIREVQKIILNHKITIIHTHDTSAILASKVASILNLPLIYTVHGKYYDFFPQLKHTPIEFISVSPSIKHWLQTKGISSTLIPNGIDFEIYKAVDNPIFKLNLGIPTNAPVIVYAARLGNYKKFKLCEKFINTCILIRRNLLPSLHVAIVGGSDTQKKNIKLIINKVNTINFQNRKTFIHVLGERKDMNKIYNCADCVVGTGRIALEAMACEKNVIAVGSVGYVGLITPNNFNKAYNFHFGDHGGQIKFSLKDFYKDIKRVFLSQNEKIDNAKKNRELVMKFSDIEHITNKLIDIYKQNINY